MTRSSDSSSVSRRPPTSIRESIDDALDKSPLNDSKREKEINRYVKEVEDATDRLEKPFRR